MSSFYQCNKCNKKYKSPEKWKDHLISSHGVNDTLNNAEQHVITVESSGRNKNKSEKKEKQDITDNGKNGKNGKNDIDRKEEINEGTKGETKKETNKEKKQKKLAQQRQIDHERECKLIEEKTKLIELQKEKEREALEEMKKYAEQQKQLEHEKECELLAEKNNILRQQMELEKQWEKYEKSEIGVCVICMTSKSNCVIIPCGHICSCKDCITEMMKTKKTCPACNQNITMIKTIFIL